MALDPYQALSETRDEHRREHPAVADDQHRERSISDEAENGPLQKKPKQTRNKPTLSCLECVNHKTKCDRTRPVCLACLKRNCPCQYSHIANVLATNGDTRQKRRRSSKISEVEGGYAQQHSPMARPPSKCSIDHITNPPSQEGISPQSFNSPQWNSLYRPVLPPQGQPQQLPPYQPTPPAVAVPRYQSPYQVNGNNGRSTSATGFLPSMDTTPMSVFGMGGEHPFANYWTCKGGLAEVIRVLPSKEQADILVAQYFEIIDPIYPIVDRPSFLKEYEVFWSLSQEDKCKHDAATVSLHFVIYAAATQFIKFDPPTERTKAAEFYISAGHQALRISSYLNHMTITTVQTMLVIYYFLTHDNHISDAWTFSGITQRQAYVLQLNREPILVTPNASVAEMNMRCKLWAAIVFQESTIALDLRLPSTSLQSDVGPHSLSYDEADKTVAFNNSLANGEPPTAKLCSELTKTDISYVKSIWSYSSFVQENICRQRALGLPLCQSNEHKREMLSAFRSLYRSFPQPFGSYDSKRFLDPSRRVARQQIVLTQSFFHAMMLICADENPQVDVIADSYSTFEAAHEAMNAFFAMNSLFGDETNAWWAYQHKAFEEAMLVANLLANDTKSYSATDGNTGLSREHNMLVTAKEDIKTLLTVFKEDRGFFEYQDMQNRRFETLRAVFESITVV